MPEGVVLFDQKPSAPDITDEVIRGLDMPEKRLSPKYFYDERGSELFDAITRLPEYYLTRTEVGILERHRDDMTAAIGSDSCIVEYGSGTSAKIRILLEAVRPKAYVPVDISKDHLVKSAQQIQDDYPNLLVLPTCADYTRPFALPPEVQGLRRTAFFPGSSIGNFEPESARAFVAGVREVVGTGGLFLVGVDMKKAPDLLNAAYNDSSGVTAEFNLNMLVHLNDRIGTDFDVDAFDHFAEYNETRGRIEMHLVSRIDQRVTVDGRTFEFLPGERLHTESSYKYSRDEFVALAGRAGFEPLQEWSDPDALFMIFLLG